MPVMTSDSGVAELITEISRYKIIGHKAETACFKLYHTHPDPKIREGAKLKIIESNLRFVFQFAMDYHNSTGLPTTDFYAEGKLGLLEAFYKYDYRTGVKFDSFAIWEVRRHMAMIVQGRDLVHVPVRQRKRVLKALREGKPLDMKYGEEAANAIAGPDSLDMPVGEDGENSTFMLHDIIPDNDVESGPDSGTMMEDLRTCLEDEMNRVLDPVETKLLRSLYGIDGEGSSFEREAVETGLSKDYIRKLKNQALEKLRDSKRLNSLR